MGLNSELVIVVLSLSALNVVQFLFWGWQVQRLVDKNMARDFGDYQRSLRPKNTSPRILDPIADHPPEGLMY